MEDIIALMIPIVAITVFGLWVTPIGGALARRIGGQAARDGEHDERLLALEHEVAGLREQLGETQERVDFTERMLAQVREAQRLPPPPPTAT